MDNESLKQQALELRQSGVTTPEICATLGLDLEAVLSLLIGNSQTVVTQTKSRSRKDRNDRLSHILDRLSEPASLYGYTGDLWTPCRLISRFTLPRGTVYRLIQQADLTFAARLRRQFSRKETYRWWISTILPRAKAWAERHKGLLYLLDELRPRDLPHSARIDAAASDCIEAEAGNPILICGISDTNRIAGQLHWCHKRLASHQVQQFLQGLISLHPQRKLMVLAKSKRVYQTHDIQDFLQAQEQLHLFLI